MFVRNVWLLNKRKNMEKVGAIIFIQLFPLSSFYTAICELSLQEKLLHSSVVSWNHCITWIFMALPCFSIWIRHFCNTKLISQHLTLWSFISKIFTVLLLNCRYMELFVDLALLTRDGLNISTRTRRLI